MAKIAYVVRVSAVDGRRDEALATLGKLVAATEDEPGTVEYLMHTEADDPNVIWFYELYEDQAAFEAHSGSAAMAEVAGSLGGLFDGPAEMHRLDLVTAKGAGS